MRASKRIITSFVCAVLIACTALLPLQINAKAADSYRIGYVNDPIDSCLRIRSSPGTSGAIIGYLDHGTRLNIYDEVDVSGVTWYYVTCSQNGTTLTGYVSSQYVTLAAADETFDDYLDAQGFPDSYKDALKVLHSMYPNWVFQAVHTKVDWTTAVDNESTVGKSLVPYSWDKAYINTADVDSSGNQIGRDGSNWVSASRAAVAYYMDPRNALTTPYIFQFECLSYDSNIHTKDGVQKILNGTFMESGYTVGGIYYSYADTFMTAAEISGVSPYHLASRVRQEQGVSGTVLSDGTVDGYKGYYNFFNYGAYTTSDASAVVNGAKYAKNVSSTYYGPWNSQYNSILGGSKMLGENYINDGQNTLYFQRFNVVSSPIFSHQYMTNVAAARSESNTLMQAYSGEMLSEALVFRIPIYDNMPATAAPLPTDVESDTPNTPSETAPTYSSSAYMLTDSMVSKVGTNVSVSTFLSNITVSNGSASITTSGGSAKTSGNIATGDILQIKYASGSVVYKNIPISVTGDVNGDAQISLKDYLYVKKQILGTAVLSNAQKNAADVNKDGSISLKDYLLIKKHILGTYTVTP